MTAMIATTAVAIRTHTLHMAAAISNLATVNGIRTPPAIQEMKASIEHENPIENSVVYTANLFIA